MKLIIGGAYQGKLAYAKKQYGLTEGWIDGRTCNLRDIDTCSGITQFHEYIRRMLAKESVFDTESLLALERQAGEFAECLLQKNREIVIVTNELGCGVVPIEKTDRLWRETVGRICTFLAARADEVVRVTCGIGVKIK